jgi:MFS transporter, AAHS family, 4-hydroxybenzoate transporter
MATRKVSVTEIFDTTPFTPYQLWVCFLCFCLIIIDGFDLTVIGVAVPKIGEFLHAEPSALGLAISAGLVGPLVGSVAFGMLADLWGRKLMLVASALIFGLFTLLTAWITSVEELALCRFLGGIGLGGAIPNALAFGCEYSPSRLRATLTATMYAGIPVGAVTVALLASHLLPHYGWQSLFVVGGISPIVIGLLVLIFLPESLAFLVRQGGDRVRIGKIVSRIAPALASDPGVEFYTTEQKLPGVPVKHLFSESRTVPTVLLWVLSFLSFYLLWIVVSWLPTLLHQSGASAQQYSLAFACMNVGAIVGTIGIGRLMDRFNPFRTLKFAFVLAFITISVFGLVAGGSFVVVAVVSTATGLFVISNAGIMALATVSYATGIRGSGVGWAYAIGKIGSILAPAVGGLLLAWHWSVAQICVTNALTALLAAAAVIILERHVVATAPPSNVIIQPETWTSQE